MHLSQGVPVRTIGDRIMGTAAKNLRKARKIRIRIASELRALEKGDVRLGDVLRDPPDALGRCSIYTVLRRTPKLGDTTSEKLCKRLHIWPTDRLAQVPLEKREQLIAALPERVQS